jgi:large subunit ribosomal protein L28
MTRKCEVTGKTVMSGNNVSHSNRKTKRRFLPNLKRMRFRSDILDQDIRLRVSTQAIKTIEKHFGLDNYLLTTPISKLATQLMKDLKKFLELAII